MKKFVKMSLILLFVLGCQSSPDVAPVEIPLPPIGATYEVGLTTAQWTIPSNGADLLALSGVENGGLIGIESADGDQIELKFAISDGEGQDYCSRTLNVLGFTVASNGAFEYGPTVLELSNGTRIEKAHLTGTFTEDFSALNNMHFSGRLDLDTFDTDLLPENLKEEQNKLCELIFLVTEVKCVPCEDGRERCVPTDVFQDVNPRLEDVTLLSVTQANCHSKCTENLEDCTPSE